MFVDRKLFMYMRMFAVMAIRWCKVRTFPMII
jgi:hypothetical protein